MPVLRTRRYRCGMSDFPHLGWFFAVKRRVVFASVTITNIPYRPPLSRKYINLHTLSPR